MTKRILAVVTLVLGLALSGFAQSSLTLTATSLAAAVTTTSQTQFKLASTTGITAASTLLYLEDGNGGNPEAVFVNSVNGSYVGVTRGYNGTQANQHISGTVVLYGPANSPGFVSVDPSGACTAASATTPTVNVLTGRQWICSTISGSWVAGFFNDAKNAGVTTAVASATTMTPSGPLFHVTGSTAITTIGSGVGMGGSATSPTGAYFCIIPDNATVNGLTAGNNIAKSTTFVVNQPVCLQFDQTNKKYVASY